MNKAKKFMSLRNKLFLIMALALIAAATVFFACREFGSFLVWRYYLNEENRQEREKSYIGEFQQYVVENRLSINDLDKIADWSGGRYVDIVLYKDMNLIYTPDWFQNFDETPDEGETADESLTQTDDENESDTEPSTEVMTTEEGSTVYIYEYYPDLIPDDGWFSGDRGFTQYLTAEAREQYQSVLDSLLDENRELSPVYFVDGTLLIRVVDYSEEFMDNVVAAMALITAVLLFAVVMIWNFTVMARRVNKLAHKVNLVERGSLEMPIHLEGNDELAALADDVNSMRNAVVDNMTKEKQAWEANAELITAMSHDIRTPLTVLLGYLDLLELQNKNNDNTEYIEACRENAMRLKRLSDDMFSYFLVFGKNGAELNLTEYRDGECIEHIIAEHSLLLSEKGYELKREGKLPKVTFHMDIAYFSRVIDNIFSNINKYAAPNAPVIITTGYEMGKLTVTFENRAKTEGDTPESNRIGLKTCLRIMEQMGGTLQVNSEGERFVTSLSIPAEEQ